MMPEKIFIKRSNRKTLSIEIGSDLNLYVKAPLNLNDSEIKKFISSKRTWIEKHMLSMKERQEEAAKNAEPKLTNEDIKALADKALEYIPKRVEYFAKQLGVTYNRITIRNQTTRWGRCSGKKNLNFNCLLMLMPKEMIDYTIVHELCHLKEMNHSKKFYSLVASILPDYKEREKWFKENGNRIMMRMKK